MLYALSVAIGGQTRHAHGEHAGATAATAGPGSRGRSLQALQHKNGAGLCLLGSVLHPSAGLTPSARHGAVEVEAFLNWLASERSVAPSTHNQALSALLFLYTEVLGIDLPWMQEIG